MKECVLSACGFVCVKEIERERARVQSSPHHVHHGGTEIVDDGRDELPSLNVGVVAAVRPAVTHAHINTDVHTNRYRQRETVYV